MYKNTLVIFIALIIHTLRETTGCPESGGACLRRCSVGRTDQGGVCPRGRVCCLRRAADHQPLGSIGVRNQSSQYISKWLGEEEEDHLHQKESGYEETSGQDYSSWSYLRNKSQSNRIPKAELMTGGEVWGNLGIELPVDMDSVKNSKKSVVLEPAEEVGPGDGKLVDYNSWTRFLDYLYNSTSLGRKAARDTRTYDCGDAEDRLRCRRSCPERRRVPEKSCPFSRVCCRGKPSSIYSPLRQAPFYRVTSAPPPQQDVFNYLVDRWNKTEPPREVMVEESNAIPPKQPVKSSPISSNDIEDNNVIPVESTRKSVHFCKKYQELTIDYLHAMPLLPEFMPFTLPMDNCLPLFMPLIVGGQNVTRGEFPHMAAIGYEKEDFTDYLCGGTLISNKFILTAAHCAQTKWGPPVTVMLGSPTLYSAESTEVGVRRTIAHPDYRPPSYYHDIALLELAEEVDFSRGLRPACLALPGTEAQQAGSVTIATGWGKTGFARQSSMQLKKVPLKVISNDKCEEFYASEIRQPALQEGINENLMCASGHASQYHDTCQGDSGGPLQAFIPGHNCMLEVVAVTSFGKTCGTAIPGVYTKIEPYLSWIEEIVWP